MPFNMIGSIINSSVNAATTNKTNKENNAFTQQQNQINRDWQTSENEITRGREDNAIQRQMADAEKAGVNPFALAGSGGASAGIMSASQGTAPQNQAPQIQLDTSGIMAGIAKMGDFARSKAETDLMNAQTSKTIGETNMTTQAMNYAKSRNLNPKDTSTPTAENQLKRTMLDVAEKTIKKGTDHVKDLGSKPTAKDKWGGYGAPASAYTDPNFQKAVDHLRYR